MRLRPDVIVTDISMPPGLSGLDVLARLKAERVDSKVIVLTMHNDAELAARAVRAGASALSPETLGRRGTGERHSPGLAGPGLPHTGVDEGRHGAAGRPRRALRAGVDRRDSSRSCASSSTDGV